MKFPVAKRRPPFVTLPRHKRSHEVFRLKGKMRRDAAEYGGRNWPSCRRSPLLNRLDDLPGEDVNIMTAYMVREGRYSRLKCPPTS